MSGEVSSDLLTVIFTTSPTPSAPSTGLLSAVVESFSKHCRELLKCRVVVVLDSYDHIAPKQLLKRARVTQQIADDYDEYKSNVKELILQQFIPHDSGPDLNQWTTQAEFGLPGDNGNTVSCLISQTVGKEITFVEPSQCLGFSLAVRSALRLTTTNYVWVHQHDWTLVSDIPILSMLQVMQASESNPSCPVNYICLPSIRMLAYVNDTDVQSWPALKAATSSLKRTFTTSIPHSPHLESSIQVEIPLTPLFFWYDKPHIANTAHYLARVFPSRLAARRGDFIEDSIGRKAREQMKEGGESKWRKWGTWLYYPDDGTQLCLTHMDGRFWRGVKGESEAKKRWIEIRKAEEKEERGQREIMREVELEGLFS